MSSDDDDSDEEPRQFRLHRIVLKPQQHQPKPNLPPPQSTKQQPESFSFSSDSSDDEDDEDTAGRQHSTSLTRGTEEGASNKKNWTSSEVGKRSNVSKPKEHRLTAHKSSGGNRNHPTNPDQPTVTQHFAPKRRRLGLQTMSARQRQQYYYEQEQIRLRRVQEEQNAWQEKERAREEKERAREEKRKEKERVQAENARIREEKRERIQAEKARNREEKKQRTRERRDKKTKRKKAPTARGNGVTGAPKRPKRVGKSELAKQNARADEIRAAAGTTPPTTPESPPSTPVSTADSYDWVSTWRAPITRRMDPSTNARSAHQDSIRQSFSKNEVCTGEGVTPKNKNGAAAQGGKAGDTGGAIRLKSTGQKHSPVNKKKQPPSPVADSSSNLQLPLNKPLHIARKENFAPTTTVATVLALADVGVDKPRAVALTDNRAPTKQGDFDSTGITTAVSKFDDAAGGVLSFAALAGGGATAEKQQSPSSPSQQKPSKAAISSLETQAVTRRPAAPVPMQGGPASAASIDAQRMTSEENHGLSQQPLSDAISDHIASVSRHQIAEAKVRLLKQERVDALNTQFAKEGQGGQEAPSVEDHHAVGIADCSSTETAVMGESAVDDGTACVCM